MSVHLAATTPPPPIPSGGGPAQAELLASVLLERSPLLVYVVDNDGKVVLLNRALRELTGYDTSLCPDVSSLVTSFYPDKEYGALVAKLHEGWSRNEHLTDTELNVSTRTGEIKKISWSTCPLRFGRGPTLGFLALGIDITFRRRLQDWLGLFQLAFQHIDEGVVLANPDGQIQAWNDGAQQLLGHTAASMEGRQLKELFLTSERELLTRAIHSKINDEGRYRGLVTLQRAEGDPLQLDLRQLRLDGEMGAPLALLTVLSEPDRQEQLEGRLSWFETELATAQNADKEAREELESARVALEEAQRGLNDAQQTEETLRKELAVHVSGEETLRKELTQRVGEGAMLREKLGNQTEEEARLRAMLALQVGEEEGLRNEVRSQTEDATNLRIQLDKLTDETATLRQELADRDEDLVTHTTDLVEARGQLTETRAHVASLEDALTDVQRKLDASSEKKPSAQADPEALSARIAEMESSLAEMEAERDDLKARCARSEELLEQSRETWVQERSRIEESHRINLDEMQQTTASERQVLEEQVKLDILAAEERAETNRHRVDHEHDQERDEWKATIAIARAEAESGLRDELQLLRRRLERPENLQSHLDQLNQVAFAAADTDGRVIGWSGGAALLDGRGPEKAVGATIHQDVLRLDGVDWKSLFGKIIIGGAVQREVVLVTADGSQQQVHLRATLIRDSQGRPVGVCEELRPQANVDATTETDAEQAIASNFSAAPRLQAQAALNQLLRPVLQALEARATETTETWQQEQEILKVLVSIATAVQSGQDLDTIRAEAAQLGVEDILSRADEVSRVGEDSCRVLFDQLRDLRQLTEATLPGGEDTHRWNDLVVRCLDVYEQSGAASVERKLGDSAVILGRGPLLVPMILTMLSGLPVADGGASVGTEVNQDGEVLLIVEGPALAAHTLALARTLAAAASGSLHEENAGANTRYELRLPVVDPRTDDSTSPQTHDLFPGAASATTEPALKASSATSGSEEPDPDDTQGDEDWETAKMILKGSTTSETISMAAYTDASDQAKEAPSAGTKKKGKTSASKTKKAKASKKPSKKSKASAASKKKTSKGRKSADSK